MYRTHLICHSQYWYMVLTQLKLKNLKKKQILFFRIFPRSHHKILHLGKNWILKSNELTIDHWFKLYIAKLILLHPMCKLEILCQPARLIFIPGFQLSGGHIRRVVMDLNFTTEIETLWNYTFFNIYKILHKWIHRIVMVSRAELYI